MSSWNHPLPYFPAAELACQGTGLIKLDRRFAAALVTLRFLWAKPLTPTSVCRAPSHNTAVGGHPRSLHLTDNPARPEAAGTMAIDVRWSDWSREDRVAFCQLAWGLGFSIGLNDLFCHLDLRIVLGLPQHVFTYGSNWTGTITEDEIRG